MSTNYGDTGSKKTWDDWSDFSINKAVAKKLGIGLGIRQPKSSPSSVRVRNGMVFDYCNNPADMWTIIVENGIVVTPCMGANIGDATGYSEHKNPVIIEFNDNSKALRAAAIVFIEMNGVKPNA